MWKRHWLPAGEGALLRAWMGWRPEKEGSWNFIVRTGVGEDNESAVPGGDLVMNTTIPHRKFLPIITLSSVGSIFIAAMAVWMVLENLKTPFERSRPAFDALAARVAGDPANLPKGRIRLGEYTASSFETLPHGFLFRSDYGHPLDWNGFAYSTEPLPAELPRAQPANGRTSFRPLDGPWYWATR
jgi:hypothetical protein